MDWVFAVSIASLPAKLCFVFAFSSPKSPRCFWCCHHRHQEDVIKIQDLHLEKSLFFFCFPSVISGTLVAVAALVCPSLCFSRVACGRTCSVCLWALIPASRPHASSFPSLIWWNNGGFKMIYHTREGKVTELILHPSLPQRWKLPYFIIKCNK